MLVEVTNMARPPSDRTDDRDRELAWDELRDKRTDRQPRQRTTRRNSTDVLDDAPPQRPSGVLKYPYLAYEFLYVTLVSLSLLGYILVSAAIAAGFIVCIYAGFFDPVLGHKLEYLITVFFASRVSRYLFAAGLAILYGVLILTVLTLTYSGFKKVYQRVSNALST
jgi:hypothetical protein